MHALWIHIFYQPLYNLLVFILKTAAFHDVGIAVILLTLIVKVALLPITRRSIISQRAMRMLEPETKKIKAEFKGLEAQKKIAELHKRNGISPASSCILALIQFPIIIALYFVFKDDITTSVGMLYSFVHLPLDVHTKFLGLFEMAKPSVVLAVIAAVSTFFYFKIQNDAMPKSSSKDIAGMMQKQMQYMLPVIIFIAGLKFPAAVALYYTISNIVSVVQELQIRKLPVTAIIPAK